MRTPASRLAGVMVASLPPPPPPLPDAAATAAACAWTAGLIDLSQIPTRPFLTKRFPDRYSLTWCDSLGEDRAACRRSYAVMKDGTARRCVYHDGRCEMSGAATGCRRPVPPPPSPPPPWPPQARSVAAACDASLPTSERVVLQLLVPAFHGSTALEGVLMSSDRVATICSAKTHNCEGSWLLEDGEWPVAAVLDRFSEFWDLSLPVLMVKSAAASESSYESLQYTQGSIPDGDVLPIPLDVSHAAPMPPRMVARGIGRLRPAYLMMWRPWCLAPLSSHARDKGAPSSAGWQRFELELNEYQAETHRVLTSHGESVLVLNYADLLWDATAARRRIERWAPCAGALDPSVNERLEVQRSGGHWKNAASVTTYATAHPPAASGYDPRRGACVETLYSDELSADEVRRADEAIAYLSVESRIEVEVPPRPPTPSPPPTPPLPPTTTPPTTKPPTTTPPATTPPATTQLPPSPPTTMPGRRTATPRPAATQTSTSP